jgi:hypothetical protein
MAFSPFVCRGKAVLTVPQNERGIYAPAWTKIENTSPQFQNIMQGYCKWFLQLAVKFATHNVYCNCTKTWLLGCIKNRGFKTNRFKIETIAFLVD